MNAPIDNDHVLVIEYDPASNGFKWAVKGQIPILLLVGELEIVKATFVNQMLMLQAQAQANQPRLHLPNGPIPPFRS
jgi:hypothetical protein